MDKKSFLRLTTLLTPLQKKKGIGIALLTVLGSLLDFISVATFLPLLYVIIRPESLEGNEYVKSVYHWGGFESYTVFLTSIISVVGLLLIIKNYVAWRITKAKAKYAFSLGSDLSSSTMQRYSQMNYALFPDVDFTKELNRITNYPFALSNNIVLPLLNLSSEIFVCTLIVIGLSFYNIQVVIIILVILVPAVVAFRIRKKNLESISNALKSKYPALLKNTLRMIEGFAEIRAFRKQVFFHSRFEAINKEVAKTMIKDHVAQNGTARLTEVMVSTAICILILYPIVTGQTQEQTLLLIGVFATAGFRIIPSVNRIFHALQQMRVHEHVIEELQTLTADIKTPTGEMQPSRMVFKEAIALKNISFAYPNGLSVLRNVNLEIPRGHKIAIQGKSGEGKTTLFLILLRFVKEQSGEMLVDGEYIIDENVWRSVIGYVPQNPYILDGTVLENIAFGIPLERVDRKRVVQLIHQLRLTDLINQLPDGVETIMGERGVKLSGGQRQRLAIARALYADADILLLDEITNQVHPSLEREILTILDALSKQNKTIVVITHKVPDDDFFDSVYSLENGVLKALLLSKARLS